MSRYFFIFLFGLTFSVTSSFSQSPYYYKSLETLKQEREKAINSGNEDKKNEITKELDSRNADSKQIETLNADLTKKIEAEDYLEAQKIKETMTELKSNQSKAEELRKKLETAISTEDYENAEQYKNELIGIKSKTETLKQQEKSRAESDKKEQENAALLKKQEEEKKRQEEQRAKEAAEQRAREDAEQKRKAEEQAEAENKKRLEQEQRSKEAAEQKAREEAEQNRKAEEQVRVEAENKKLMEEEQRAKEVAEQKAREEAEQKIKAEEQARMAAEAERLAAEKAIREKAEAEARKNAEEKEREFNLYGYSISDDFSDNKNQWKEENWNKHNTQISGGKLIIEGLSDDLSFRNVLNFPVNTDKDFTVQASVLWVKGDNNNGFGIDFASNFAENSYYSFQIAAIGYYSILRFENGKWTELTSWTENSNINQNSQPNILKIKKEDDYVYYYVNNSLLDKKPWTGGLGNDFGFRVFDKQMVEFDDFLLRGIKKETLATKTEEVLSSSNNETVIKETAEKKTEETKILTANETATKETVVAKVEETQIVKANQTTNIFQIKNKQAQLISKINKLNTTLVTHQFAVDELKKKKKLSPELSKYVSTFDDCSANFTKAKAMVVEDQSGLDELSRIATEMEQQLQDIESLKNSK